jgi:hypothetical protein
LPQCPFDLSFLNANLSAPARAIARERLVTLMLARWHPAA